MDDKSVAVVEKKGSVALGSPYAPRNFSELWTVGKLLWQSGYFTSVKDASQACVKIMAGYEMGFSPIAALMHTYFINGKLAYEGVLLASAAKRKGYNFVPVKWTSEECEVRFTGPGLEGGAVVSFTMKDAQAAGLAGKDNWKKHPKMMLWWRTIAQGVRAFCPDVFGAGPAPYLPDELGAETDSEGAPLVRVIEPEPRSSGTELKQKFEEKKRRVKEKEKEKTSVEEETESPWSYSIRGGQFEGRTLGDIRMSGELTPELPFDGFTEEDRSRVIAALNLVAAEEAA